MKKQLFSLFLMISSFFSFSQVNNTDKLIALQLINRNANEIGLSKEDLNNLEVSSSYFTESSNLRMVYLTQTVFGKSIHNQMLVLAFSGDKLVSKTGAFLSNVNDRINAPGAEPKISASQAIQSLVGHFKLTLKEKIVQTGVEGSKMLFGTLGISNVEIKADLVWQFVDDKWLKLAWEIELAPIGSSDHWMIRVDALNSKILDQNNYTVHEHLDEQIIQRNLSQQTNHTSNDFLNNQNWASALLSPQIVSNAQYRVIPYPAESPLHTGGTAAIVSNPWTLASGNATSLKWHYDGTTYHDSTRGNNVWAQEDRDNSNTTFGKTGVSTTAQPDLTFTTAPDYTVVPTTASFQQFAITNLFYWNNIMHDVSYIYGFNEVSGNFQNNNQSRGGSGADYVIADAQDASGTNNANFSTPVDGTRPRMQMYLSTYTTPNRDGDLDNGVIAHEYGHGISNRLTGGPANSSCLSNAEQGGEGWSDYMALMTTTNWATATVNDGGLSRPIGTYLFGQSPTGAGIRTYPYSTNMTTNPNTYAMMASTTGAVHRIGEIWCSALWDMTWELIAVDGINPNLFNAAGTGGNSISMRLVIEGMRLQPCSPGFIDARNAILKADSILYNGKYNCAIWKAFARRGMGRFASQGTSSSTTDQVADFTDGGSAVFSLNQSVQQQTESGLVTYTHTIKAGNCSAISNYTLRDTLPSNVTYVSGGTYNSNTRVVQFAVNVATGQTQTYAFTVQINAGSYFPPIQLINEKVDSATIQPFWTRSSTTSTIWKTSTAQKVSAPYSFYTPDTTIVSDQKLEMTNALTVPANPPLFSFMGYINSESKWDGGVVEITTNNGTSWTDLGPNMISGGYTGPLSSSLNPLTGRSAFYGNSAGFVKTEINLSSFANQTVKIRFRFGSDASVGGTGWFIDDISMRNFAQVKMKSYLFNSNNVLVATLDTITTILPNSDSCQPAIIQSQPVATSVCSGTTASFSVIASGTNVQYQWQVSTNGGSSFSNLPGETNSTLSVNTSSVISGNQYRCAVSNSCTALLNSNAVALTIWALPAAPTSAGAARCGTGTLTISTSGVTNTTSEWYAASVGGNPLATGNSYSTPSIASTTTYYLGSIESKGCRSANRNAVIATINAIPSAPTTIGATTCAPGAVRLTASTGAGNSIDWYSASSGANLLQSNTLQFTTPVLNSTTIYYAESRSSVNCTSVTRTAATATVLQTSSSQTNASICANALPYVWNNNTYTATGSYQVKLTNAAGCDSMANLALTVKNNSSSTTQISVCDKQLPYSWNGLTFTQAGTQTATLVASNGCDSLATLILNIQSTASSSNSISVCSNQMPFNWNGLTFTESGTQTATLTTAGGCDSLASLTLSVLPNTSSSTQLTICSNQLPFSWNGLTFTQAGTQTASLIGSNGCDSSASLTLSVKSVSSSSTQLTICSNQLPYSWNGLTFTQAGTQTASLTASNGCDSLATLTLIVKPASSSTTQLSICSNQLPYTWNGLTFSQAGTQTATLTASNGCDSLATLILATSGSAPLTPASITQTLVDNSCGARIYRYTASAVTNSTGYNWTLPSTLGGILGVTVDSGDASSSRVIRLKYTSNLAAAATDSIRVSAYNACASSTNRVVKLTNTAWTALANPTITTTNLITNQCGGRKVRYSIPQPATTSGNVAIQWSFVGNSLGSNAMIDSGTVSSRIIVVLFTSNAASNASDSIRVRYNYNNGCSFGTFTRSSIVLSALNPPAAPTITATNLITNVCGGRKVRYSVPSTPAATSTIGAATGYSWSLVGTGLSSNYVVDSGSLSSRVVVIRYLNNTAAAASDSVRCRYTSGCGFGPNGRFKNSLALLNPPAAPTITATNLVTNICGGRKVRYSVPLTPAATSTTGAATGYDWSLVGTGLSSNYVVDSGSLSSRVVVIRYLNNTAAAASDSVRCRYTSGCGFGANGRFKNNLALLNPPAAPAITATNLVTNICGGRKVRYSVPVLPAATSTRGAATGYDWSLVGTGLSTNYLVDSGSLTSRIVVIRYLNNTAAATSDSIRCRYASGCGFSANGRLKINLSALNAPASPSSITGLTSICPIVGTNNGTTYTSSAVTGALNYVWTIPSGAVIDSGSNGLKIRVRFLTASSRDTIQVQSYNGCLSAKRSLPLITTGCATSISGKQSIPTSSLININQSPKIYPNPSSSYFNLLMPFSNQSVQVKVYDVKGVLIESRTASATSNIQIGMKWKPGSYFVETWIDGKRSMNKVLKQ